MFLLMNEVSEQAELGCQVKNDKLCNEVYSVVSPEHVGVIQAKEYKVEHGHVL